MNMCRLSIFSNEFYLPSSVELQKVFIHIQPLLYPIFYLFLNSSKELEDVKSFATFFESKESIKGNIFPPYLIVWIFLSLNFVLSLELIWSIYNRKNTIHYFWTVPILHLKICVTSLWVCNFQFLLQIIFVKNMWRKRCVVSKYFTGR